DVRGSGDHGDVDDADYAAGAEVESGEAGGGKLKLRTADQRHSELLTNYELGTNCGLVTKCHGLRTAGMSATRNSEQLVRSAELVSQFVVSQQSAVHLARSPQLSL